MQTHKISKQKPPATFTDRRGAKNVKNTKHQKINNKEVGEKLNYFTKKTTDKKSSE